MKILDQDLCSFAEAKLTTFNLSKMSKNINKDVAINFLKDEIQKEFTELNVEKVKKQRMDFFKVGRPSDYTEHLIELGENKKIICGIRYIGCDLDYPFVKLSANFSISSKKDVQDIYEVIQNKFTVFSPRYVSVNVPQKIEESRIGYVYMVAPFETVNATSPWEYNDHIELKKISDESYYDWYCEGYNEFHIEHPDLKARVQVNSKKVMRESLEQGLLYYALLENQKVGLIAGVKSDFLGHSGLYFNEILVRKKWKGKSLAKVIQQKMIKETGAFCDFVWGTIDYRNQPSFKTALSNGRQPVCYEHFIKV